MPNVPYMAVNGLYPTALAVWVGGMAAFALLFVPSLTTVLARPDTGRVAVMTGLAAYDLHFLAPRLAAARAGDEAGFGRLHTTAIRTMGATMALGLVALFAS